MLNPRGINGFAPKVAEFCQFTRPPELALFLHEMNYTQFDEHTDQSQLEIGSSIKKI